MIDVKKYFVLSLIFICFLFFGCMKDEFKQSCLGAKEIIEQATSLLIPESQYDDQTQITTIRYSNAKALEYLKKKDQEFKQFYQQIKGVIDNSNSNRNDAIYAVSYLNEMYYFLTGNELDNRCYYISLIQKNRNLNLSAWLIDDFFSPAQRDKKLQKDWKHKDNKEKRKTIIQMLTTAKDDCN